MKGQSVVFIAARDEPPVSIEKRLDLLDCLQSAHIGDFMSRDCHECIL